MSEEFVSGIYSYLVINCIVNIYIADYVMNVPACNQWSSIICSDWTWTVLFTTDFHRNRSGSSQSSTLLLRLSDLSFHGSSCSVQKWNCHKIRQLQTSGRTGSPFPMLLEKCLDVEIQRHIEPQRSARVTSCWEAGNISVKSNHKYH